MSFPQFIDTVHVHLMTILITAIAFILLLTLLILIHELGHYLMARAFGVEVEEFGFGLPPKAKKLFRSGGTDFTLNWIPFGGFVRLKGENAIDVEERYAPGSFGHASILARILILCAGVGMNFFLAFSLLTLGFSVGHWVPNFYSSIEELEQAASRGEVTMKPGIYINDVVGGSPAAKAGIVKDSVVVSIDGQVVQKPEQLLEFQKGKKQVTYVLLEGKDRVRREVVVPLEDGKSGIVISAFAAELSAPTRPLGEAVKLALHETSFMSVQTVQGIGDLVRSLVTTGRVPKGITGIVGIAVLTYGSVQEGFMTYLRLVALLSLSLAILNILPLPALDGGRLLFVLVELFTRRPVNQRVELLTNTVGFFVLIALIVVITFNDVIHLF